MQLKISFGLIVIVLIVVSIYAFRSNKNKKVAETEVKRLGELIETPTV